MPASMAVLSAYYTYILPPARIRMRQQSRGVYSRASHHMSRITYNPHFSSTTPTVWDGTESGNDSRLADVYGSILFLCSGLSARRVEPVSGPFIGLRRIRAQLILHRCLYHL